MWFTPKKKVPIRELHLAYDPDNPWLVRIKDIYRAGMKKWGGNVCMGMTDLGGVLDILASFLTTDQLLYDLYDEPEEVQRLGRFQTFGANFIARFWKSSPGSRAFRTGRQFTVKSPPTCCNAIFVI